MSEPSTPGENQRSEASTVGAERMLTAEPYKRECDNPDCREVFDTRASRDTHLKLVNYAADGDTARYCSRDCLTERVDSDV